MREGEALFTPIKTDLYSLMLFKNACINQKKVFRNENFFGAPKSSSVKSFFLKSFKLVVMCPFSGNVT